MKILHVLKEDDKDNHLYNELEKRAKQIKPFRHPQDIAFFGTGLSTNTLGEKGYGELRALSPRPEGFVKERNKAQTEGTSCQESAFAKA
jgi:hypothetical protein